MLRFRNSFKLVVNLIFLSLVNIGLSIYVHAFNGSNNPSWEGNPGTIEGQVQVLSALYSALPKVMNAVLAFRRNPIQVLRLAAKLGSKLNLQSSFDKIESTDVHFLEYSTGDAPIEASEDLFKISIQLKDEYELVKGGAKPTLIETLNFYQKDSKMLGLFLRLAPLMYDSSGILLDLNKIEMTFENPFQLAQTFWSDRQEDILNYIIKNKEVIEIPSIEQQVMTTRNRLWIQFSSNAFFKSKNLTSVTSIEKVPKLMSLFRGSIAWDCSDTTVNYYALLDEVSVYWIRKGKNLNSQPDGYALVVTLDLDGRKVPYILTINGLTLNEYDTVATVQMIRDEFHSQDFIQPINNDRLRILNNDKVVKGLNTKDGESTLVSLPSAWQQVEDFLRGEVDFEHPLNSKRYYSTGNIERGILGSKLTHSLNVVSKGVRNAVSRYNLNSSVKTIPKFQRATVAYQAIADIKNTLTQDKVASILEKMGVTQEEMALASSLVTASQNQPISKDNFRNLVNQLEFSFDFLLKMEPLTLSRTLHELYTTDSELKSKKDWEALFENLHGKLDRRAKSELVEQWGKDYYSVAALYMAQFKSEEDITAIFKNLTLKQQNSIADGTFLGPLNHQRTLSPFEWLIIKNLLTQSHNVVHVPLESQTDFGSESTNPKKTTLKFLKNQSNWPTEIVDEVVKLIDDKDLKSTALEALSTLGVANSQFREVFKQLIESKRSIDLKVLVGPIRVKPSQLVKPLLQYLESENNLQEKSNILAALQHLNPAPQECLSIAETIFKHKSLNPMAYNNAAMFTRSLQQYSETLKAAFFEQLTYRTEQYIELRKKSNPNSFPGFPGPIFENIEAFTNLINTAENMESIPEDLWQKLSEAATSGFYKTDQYIARAVIRLMTKHKYFTQRALELAEMVLRNISLTAPSDIANSFTSFLDNLMEIAPILVARPNWSEDLWTDVIQLSALNHNKTDEILFGQILNRVDWTDAFWKALTLRLSTHHATNPNQLLESMLTQQKWPAPIFAFVDRWQKAGDISDHLQNQINQRLKSAPNWFSKGRSLIERTGHKLTKKISCAISLGK